MALLGGTFLDEIVLAVAVLVLAALYFRKKRDPRYPPGPPSLPVLGNLLQLGTKPQDALSRWANEYGPIFSMKMGSDDLIMLNDHKMIRDVFQMTSASGRTANPAVVAFGDGNYGVIMSEGAHWEQQRRFTLRKLRDFGFAKSLLQDVIMDEVNSMMRWFEKRLDEPIPGSRIFNGAVVTSLWKIISGERTEWNAPEPPAMCKCTDAMMEALHRINSCGIIFVPFLRFIAPEAFGWNAWIGSMKALAELANVSIQRHIGELDPNNPHDLIDDFLIEIQKETDPDSSFYKEAGEKNLKAVIPNLFFAGSETISHSLSWSLLLLAHNQEVQDKLHRELTTVLGESRQPTLGDRPNLPYTEAVVMETLRRTSVVNNGVPRRMLEDAVINGYFFPKNTTIMPNIYHVHNDPKIWGDPANFRPERFLTPDGTQVVKHEAYLPYSLGKRQCLGMSFANDTLFLFTAAIFQKFHVKPDPNQVGGAINNIMPSTKILNEPDPFKIIVSLR